MTDNCLCASPSPQSIMLLGICRTLHTLHSNVPRPFVSATAKYPQECHTSKPICKALKGARNTTVLEKGGNRASHVNHRQPTAPTPPKRQTLFLSLCSYHSGNILRKLLALLYYYGMGSAWRKATSDCDIHSATLPLTHPIPQIVGDRILSYFCLPRPQDHSRMTLCASWATASSHAGDGFSRKARILRETLNPKHQP